jgi:hypothetical protein
MPAVPAIARLTVDRRLVEPKGAVFAMAVMYVTAVDAKTARSPGCRFDLPGCRSHRGVLPSRRTYAFDVGPQCTACTPEQSVTMQGVVAAVEMVAGAVVVPASSGLTGWS